MTGAPAILVEHLGKKYPLGERVPYGVLRDAIVAGIGTAARLVTGRGSASGSDRPVVWALEDVTLEIPEGQVVGIIGRNGSGKSTLLKVLARITEPTCGRAVVRGRVGALLEVGSGFHPELTGRENIFVNGAMLGMKRREILQRFDEIVGFAGVEAFLDTPVKRYSSGMQLRLAFAVAAHLQAHILLVDEVLAVGDAEFQRRCLGKIEEVRRAGRTILLVSHQMAQIRRLCHTAVWLDRGHVRATGAADSVIHAYEAAARSLDGEMPAGVFARWEIAGTGSHLTDGQRPFAVRLFLALPEALRNGHLRAVLAGPDGPVVAGWAFDHLDLEPEVSFIDISLPQLPLRPGTYRWTFTLFTQGSDRTGGRFVGEWLAAPALHLNGTPVGHPQDAWAGVLNVPAQLAVASPAGEVAVVPGRAVDGPGAT